MNQQTDEKKAVTAVFNLVADLYDNQALRFFPLCAEKMISYAKIQPGQQVLDIATGTGMVALAAAKATGPQGHVHAIDLSENMLKQAQANAEHAGLSNITFQIMDAEQPDFEHNSFDIITCSYGLFFLPDMHSALKNWFKVLKPGGRIIFSSFAPSAFTPQSDIFLKHLAEYDIVPPTPRWLQLAETALCKTILEQNGFVDTDIKSSQLGYHLAETSDWWQAIQSAGYRGLYEQLAEDHRDEFKVKHLAEIEQQLMTDKGIWLDVETLFSTALKPS